MLDVTRMRRLCSMRWPQPNGNTSIVGFADKKTETFYRGGRVAAFSGFARTASRKLDQLDGPQTFAICLAPVTDWKP